MLKNYEALTSANKEAIDACTQFNTILAGGFQEISNHVLALAQSTIEMNLENGKAIMAIKSPQELVELQSKWMRQCFNTVLSGSAKLSEISAKITNQAAAPVQSQLHNAISIMSENVARLSEKAA